MDESGSIEPDDFEKLKQFVIQTGKTIMEKIPNTDISLVSFNETARNPSKHWKIQ